MPIRYRARVLSCLIALTAFAASVSLFSMLQTPAKKKDAQIPGNAARGEMVFREKGCVQCHAFHGRGGNVAPDLGRRIAGLYTPEMLAGAMWNHAPAMWQAAAARQMAVPNLDLRDAADLYAYFYAIRYFDRPGELTRARTVFSEKKCASCHKLRPGDPPPSGKGDMVSAAPVLSQTSSATDPIAWLREMWNHSPRMSERMRQAGIRRPKFTGQEMVDLLSFLQAVPEKRAAQRNFAPSDPDRGRELFQTKGCTNCHTVGSREAGKLDLLERRGDWTSMAETAAAMWNHAPAMQRLALQRNVTVPTFEGDEMGDIVGYLFWTGFFESKGDANAGKRVFERKHCASCHLDRSTGAPDLAQFRGHVSPIFMSTTIWRHGPQMLQAMKQKGYAWPQFAGSEMANLISFLDKYPQPGGGR